MSAQNGRWKDRMSQSDLDAVDRGIPAIAPRGKGSHETLRWSKADSNSESHPRATLPAATRFVADSALEGDGFEPSAPLAKQSVSFVKGEVS